MCYNTPMLRKIWRLIKFILLLAFIVAGINVYVMVTTFTQMENEEDVISGDSSIQFDSGLKPQCIMVLGASVYANKTPSPMLKERLDTAIALYKNGVAPKLLLSGDNGQVEYDEVAVMKNYALENGVPEEDIFLDHAGFSTYESVYRASYIFEVKRMVVVTQKYHLYRALYGCDRMGIEAVGVPSDKETFSGQSWRNLREALARTKDFVKWFIKPDPTFLGSPIPISGSGTVTDETQ